MNSKILNVSSINKHQVLISWQLLLSGNQGQPPPQKKKKYSNNGN